MAWTEPWEQRDADAQREAWPNGTETDSGYRYYIQGDFHYVEVRSGSKRAMIEAGIPADTIRKERVAWAYYGAKRYARYGYMATVHVSSPMEANTVADKWSRRGLLAYVRYHCAD